MAQVLIKKTGTPAQRLVWGEIYVPNKPDSDGEYMTAESIQKLAYEYMRKLAQDKIDYEHNNELTPGVCMVESFIARKGDPDFIEGSWVGCAHIDDDGLWEKVEKGEINGFSIEALVHREEREVTLEMPPIISGLTHKSEDHQHKFYVSYDENTSPPRFKGGTTDVVNGHSHLIKRGTATEQASGHNHRFSAIDQIEMEIAE